MILKHTSVGECQRSVVVEARGAFRCWMNNCVSETASLCLCICGRRKLLLLLSCPVIQPTISVCVSLTSKGKTHKKPSMEVCFAKSFDGEESVCC